MDENRQQRLVDVVVPELGLPGWPVRLVSWLVETGRPVLAGDPVAELLVADALVDVPAPVNGRLAERIAAEGETVAAHAVIGRLEADS
ncbi:MAG: hypothetical protein KatS3mg110_4398 [Pirellulaceae bacterium]|nr:MAG: hypothetical protein KatS3mg110_4398 [Pirellulaceae bacterium]